MENGFSLEPVGSRTVVEVFISLLNAIESPYLATQANWTAEGAGPPFTLAEKQGLLTHRALEFSNPAPKVLIPTDSRTISARALP